MNYNKCLEYLGYYAMIEYSAEDESFIGKILGITDTLVFDGTTIDELKQQFHDTVDDYLSLCEEIGKQPDKSYKGSFNVSIPPELHRKASLMAMSQEISLNQFVETAIYEKVYANNKSVTNVEAHFYLGKISSNPLHTSFEETNSVTKEINYVGLKQ